jgi:hypothetical protein
VRKDGKTTVLVGDKAEAKILEGKPDAKAEPCGSCGKETERKKSESPKAKESKKKRKKNKGKLAAKKSPAPEVAKPKVAEEPPTPPAATPLTFGDDPNWSQMLDILSALEKKTKSPSSSAEPAATGAAYEEEPMDKCGFCFLDDFDLPRCGRCGVFNYCSEKCLQQDERNHEKDCKEAQRDEEWNEILRKTKQEAGPVTLSD